MTDSNDIKVPLQHPLLNYVVLKEILKLLKSEDMPACRLVCKRWNEQIVARMRLEFMITFKAPSQNSLKDFVSLMETSDIVPFGQFVLHEVDISNEVVKKFFDLCQPCVKHMELKLRQEDLSIYQFEEIVCFETVRLECDKAECIRLNNQVIDGNDIFSKVDSDATSPKNSIYQPCLPYLKEIVIGGLETIDAGFLLDFFSAACNLEELEIVYQRRKDKFPHKIIRALHDAGHFRKLKRLNFPYVGDDDFRLLIPMSEQGMKLNQLYMDYLHNCFHFSLYIDMMYLQKDTLDECTGVDSRVTKKKKPGKVVT